MNLAKLLTRCPVCDGTLHVTELTCGHCSTHLGGLFATCRFCRAAPETLAFVETFLRCEGNLSRVGEELSVSYPTVRNRLAATLNALGLSGEIVPDVTPKVPSPTVETIQQCRAVLEQLAEGTITAEEAAALMREG